MQTTQNWARCCMTFLQSIPLDFPTGGLGTCDFMRGLISTSMNFSFVIIDIQIYARQFSSLQPNLKMRNPRIHDFVEALTNTIMYFLFAI